MARAAADAVERAGPLPPVLVGFDGFIDTIVHMVRSRTDMGPGGYERITTIGEFASRCAAAAGKSTNIEQVLVEERYGGNGPLMAGALGRLGVPVTYIGAVAGIGEMGTSAGERADGEAKVHVLFEPFAARCRRVYPIAPPSYTLCLEFDDGKLMFNNTRSVQACTWERVREVVGRETVRRCVEDCRLIGVVNWSLLGGVPGILEGLRECVASCAPAERRLFIDLSDPAKRTDDDIRAMLSILSSLEEERGLSVTLGLNLSEAQRIDAASGAGAFPGHAAPTTGGAVMAAATRLRDALSLDTVVIHPREGAGAADVRGNAAWFDGPLTGKPMLSTGAGDHFNAGFAFAQLSGLPLGLCLAVGCAVSGAYVRDAASPDVPRLAAFLRSLPLPER